jgi:chromosome segregation ATPase
MERNKKCAVCKGKLTDAHGNICGKCWEQMKLKVKYKPKRDDEKLILELEKLKGKMEIFESFRPQINERISGLSEEIGDLRRMILDAEQNQTELITGFENVKALVEGTEPEKMLKRVEELAGRLELIGARAEKNEKLFSSINEEVKRNRELMSKVKGLENLVDLSKRIEEKAGKIKSSEVYTERLAAKVENIFSDLSEKLLEMKEKLATVDKLDTLSKDLLKEIDKVNLKFDEQVVSKNDLENLKSSVENKLKSIQSGIPDEIEKKIEEFASSLKSVEKNIVANKMTIENIDKKVEGIVQQTKSLEELESEREKIITLLERAERDYKAGTLSMKTYQDVTKANRNRLKIIESVLERVSREAFYRKLKMMEERLGKILDSMEGFSKKETLDELISSISRLSERVDGLENIKESFTPIKESNNILSDRISTMEERLNTIKERKRELASYESKLDDFGRKLKMIESLLHKQEKKSVRDREGVDELHQRVDEILTKVFSLEKNDDEMLHLIGKLSPPDYRELADKMSAVEKTLKELKEVKADEREVSQLKASFEDVISKNTEIIEKILKEMGV